MHEEIALCIDTTRSAFPSPNTRLTCRRWNAGRRYKNAILEPRENCRTVVEVITYRVEVFVQFGAELPNDFREFIGDFYPHRFQFIEGTGLPGYQCYDQWSQRPLRYSITIP